MADYDRRSSGGYNRKRRFRDDDDQYDRRYQRRRVDSLPVPVRLRRELLSLADSPLRRWADEVQTIARMLASHYDDDENLRTSFVGLVLQMIVEQPLKTPFVAAVVLITNTLKPEVVDLILGDVSRGLETSVSKGEWRNVKLYLKFLACLQACLEGDGVFPLLEELFNRAADLQTASSEDTIGTEIVKIILLTIPYILAAAPSESNQQKAADLMDKTDIIASEPHALQALVDPYHNEGTDESPTPSLCMLLQKQLQTEASKNWELACLPRPWQMPLEEVESQDKLANAPKHALPAISIPATVIAGPRPLFPEVYFSVYGDQEVESVPTTAGVASSLIRDAVTDTINSLDFNRNATARCLIDLDCYFGDDTFVKRATPFDDLRQVRKGQTTWKPEDVAVDTVFSQLFQLPVPEHKLVYFHSVLTEACKLAPAAIAPSLGRAIRFLYNNSPRMDLQLNYRFLDWFSHHLSNFGFTWKWAEWKDDASLPDLHPLQWFLKGALDKEVRLSFAQRIQKTLPEEYRPLIGPEKEKDVPDFKFSNPDTPFAGEGLEISTLLRRKAADEELQPVIDKIHSQASERGLDPLLSSTDVFMTAVCWVGSKSLSHALACIERAKARLLDAGASSPAVQNQIISSTMDYWHAHPGIALSILEKLLSYAIITPVSVVAWALVAGTPANGTQGGTSLAQPHVFELVSNTVSKVTNRVRQVVASSESTEETREKEIASMRDLFRAIDNALAHWIDVGGADDAVMGNINSNGEGAEGFDALVRRWAQRWARVFTRLAAMEEVFIVEAGKGRGGVVNGAEGV